MADEDLPDINSLFSMPEFRQLDGREKINALDRYPEFKALPLKEKVNAIQIGLQETAMGKKGQVPGFWKTIGLEAGAMLGAGTDVMLHPFRNIGEGMEFRARESAEAYRAMQQGKPKEAAHHKAREILGQTGSGIAHSQLEQFREAKRSYQAGETGRIPFTNTEIPLPVPAIGHAAAGLLPVAGPAAAEAGEEFQRGEYGAGAAHTALLLGPDLISAGVGVTSSLLGKASKAALRNRLTGVQAARLANIEARAARSGFRGSVATVGEARGSPMVRKIEKVLQHTPGSSGFVEDRYAARAAELERQARETIDKVSPAVPPGVHLDSADVAMDVYHEGGRTIRGLKRQADTIYDEVRAGAASDRQTLRIGTRVDVLPDGTRVVHPIMGTYDAPLPLKPVRNGLRDLYGEFRTVFKDLPESERMANPGYKSLHHIMTDVDPLTGQLRRYMGAMDLESELRAIKEQLRGGRFSRFLYSPSGRVALRIINEGEKAVGAALDRARPGLYARLQEGRKLVKAYSSADRLLTSIVGKPENMEPMKLFELMKTAGDRKIGALTRLKQIAPVTTHALARTYLEGLIKDATKDLGRLKLGAGTNLVNGLDALGPKTKRLLLGPRLTQELDDTFHVIKELLPPEGSPTAFRYPALVAVGGALEVLGSLIAGYPKVAAMKAGAMGVTAGSANLLARVLFRPGGGASVTQVLRAVRIGGEVLREAARAFEARVAVARKEQEEEKERERQAAASPAATAAPAAAPAAAEKPPAAAAPPAAPPAQQAVQRAPVPAAAPASAAPGATRNFGWTTGGAERAAVAPTPAAPARGTTETPPPGTTWEYWGQKPPPGAPDYPSGGIAPARPQAAAPRIRPASTGAPPSLMPLYQEIGRSAGVPPALLRTIATLESNENPNVRPGGAGEIGLMQFMPDTAKALGIDPHDARQSVRGAAALLKTLMQKYRGEMWKVLAAYNEGETNFDKRMRLGKPLPETTRKYIQNGLRLLGRGRSAGGPAVAETR